MDLLNYKKLFSLAIFLCVTYGFTQTSGQKKVILITLDGFRWQELFTGADSLLIDNPDYVSDTLGLVKHFWRASPSDRRRALMPFFWTEVLGMGQIHGNRKMGSRVNLTNKMWFSYPGYNEILTGRADDARIESNDKFNNPNVTVLEIANRQIRYRGKVAAFASWDVFPYIINEERSGVPVNAGFDIADGYELTNREKFLNELQPWTPSPWNSVRLDVFTHNYALEHLKKTHPELVYIAYGETDDFAHDGNYEAYLKSAHTTDAMIKELWEYTQQDPIYKDNTIFIVATDHGRGTSPLSSWRNHGNDVQNADQVWMIIFGHGIEALGEVQQDEQWYSDQIAPTILMLLGLEQDKKTMPASPLRILKD